MFDFTVQKWDMLQPGLRQMIVPWLQLPAVYRIAHGLNVAIFLILLRQSRGAFR